MKKTVLTIVFTIFTAFALGFIACGGGGGSSGGNGFQPDDCTVADQNKFVYDKMKDTYLWYDLMPEVDYAGFESPEAGAIFYDGQDLSGLDIRSVRHQLGVVLQNSQLMTGDIFTNIVGVAPLTLDDAWDAARMAGLEEDVRRMPMGLHTIVSEGGSTLSGGQRQRLLIARAIAKKPRILFFDAATSALDNRTQAIVSESLASLDATRIVIAHRLSTSVSADHIIVLETGKIVQSGTYEDLIRHEGLFADLARRQLV